MKLNSQQYSKAVLIILINLLAACGLEKSAGTPVPVGATAEVGGWSNAITTLESDIVKIDFSSGLNNSGWQVTVLGAEPTAGGIRLDLKIKNNMGNPGAIDLTKGPFIIDEQGSKTLSSMVDLGISESVPIYTSGNITDSVACTYSTADGNGIQPTACDLVLVISDGKVNLVVGAWRMVLVTIIFLTPTTANGLVMEWLDGTRFAAHNQSP
jgi:hypothetical protein